MDWIIDRGANECGPFPGRRLLDRVVLFNMTDLVSYQQDTIGRITQISLSSGAVGYAFEGIRSQNAQDEAVIRPSGENAWRHIINFVVFEIDQDQKNNLEELAAGLFFAIVENAGRDGATFEVYGINNGMEMPQGAIRNHNTASGAFTLQLATPAGQEEELLPQTLFVDNYVDTLAYVESLLTEGGFVELEDSVDLIELEDSTDLIELE